MKSKLSWSVKCYNELTLDELYMILHLRSRIFVVEQNAIYLDADFYDQKATHVMGMIDGQIVAYCRLFDLGVKYETYSSIGRVVVEERYRGIKLGAELLRYAMGLMTENNQYPIKIAAQAYLQEFYSSFGFQKVSEIYILERLEHIDMICTRVFL